MRLSLAVGLAALSLLLVTSFPTRAQDEDLPVIVVFYQEGCPDCLLIEELIEGLAYDLPPSAIRRYEITARGSMSVLRQLEAAYGIDSAIGTVPIVFAGDSVVVGAGRPQEFQLRNAIGDCVTVGCSSPLARIQSTAFPWKDVMEIALLAGLVVLFALLQFL